MKKLIVLSIILVTGFTTQAQVDFAPKSSFKVEVGLPNNASNFAFRDLMQGLVVVTPSFQHTLDNTLTFAVGLRYGFFNVNEFKNNIDMTGGVHLAGVFGKIGQEKFYGNFGIDYGIRFGYSANIFDTNINEVKLGKPLVEDAAFIEPTLGLSLMATERTSFRLALGYAIHDFVFSPNQMGMEKFSGIKDSKLDSRTSYFTIGFGYSYYFGVQ
ncbi:hypothetical protein [Brumimicrobium oceani]|uniref:Outer membrane protein beta-barrel domain-containing protein n=1 Tax=Brumimicrobium oceani TaxID=2100725 RepID=A0A2U2XFK7_9FLAO|nr:hypothetical protein [Brumimicrobium oceani]PWH86537.1 hypothetical protein DIT68_04685 [Brumimicrobium oceani]